MKSRLAIGTVQFGLGYGIANQVGQVGLSAVSKIIDKAVAARIDLIDTAIAYGNSEEVLGKVGVAKFNVVSKLPPLPVNHGDIDSWVERQVHNSLKKLGVQSLYGLLLHRSENLLGYSGKKLMNALARLKSNNLVRKVGVSIYDPSELDKVAHLMKIDLVQAPLNVIDRRLETSGWLTRLYQEGVEVHTRSAFLQGLLLMAPNDIPGKFKTWTTLWSNWAAELKKNNVSAVVACLSYPLSLTEIDRVIVGVDSPDQLKEIIDASIIKLPKYNFSSMISEDQILINPSNWSSL